MDLNSLNNRSQMVLGEVIINNECYIAVLHFKKTDGAPREINASMRKAQSVYLNCIKEIVKECSEGMIEHVDAAGFHLINDRINNRILTHEEKNTRAVWEKFNTLLEHPNLSNEIAEVALQPVRNDAHERRLLMSAFIKTELDRVDS